MNKQFGAIAHIKMYNQFGAIAHIKMYKQFGVNIQIFTFLLK